MIQPMTSGTGVLWKDRPDPSGGWRRAPVRPAVPRPTPAAPARAIRRRARRAIPVALYLQRAKLLLTAAVLLGAAGTAGQRLWRAVLPAPPAPAVIVPRTVQPGDSLWSLARRYGDPSRDIRDRVEALARANGLSAAAPLTPGQTLLVPAANPDGDGA